ncbi:hypothetical protein [Pajaroellobacter abortibovis]|uniref:Uncharacterized protein n=1 Tax=Pajaroellobacter abortibovis TaxID=1882918 RepID=A0A1L6MYZ8_9BACT|nr:hypothetical protein [Pajaroellobacter abortibovis]APS00794.1 hypothetical protein BCY86_08960 [Pajaroellobacter abortibovis]
MICSFLLGQSITATSPILRFYRRQDIQSLQLSAQGFEINAEILFALAVAGKRIAEMPAHSAQRIHGYSKLNYSKEIRRHLSLSKCILQWRITQEKNIARAIWFLIFK